MKLYGLVHWGDDELEDCQLHRVYQRRDEAEQAALVLSERAEHGSFSVMELEVDRV